MLAELDRLGVAWGVSRAVALAMVVRGRQEGSGEAPERGAPDATVAALRARGTAVATVLRGLADALDAEK